jgi:hypothetical protein
MAIWLARLRLGTSSRAICTLADSLRDAAGITVNCR